MFGSSQILNHHTPSLGSRKDVAFDWSLKENKYAFLVRFKCEIINASCSGYGAMRVQILRLQVCIALKPNAS